MYRSYSYSNMPQAKNTFKETEKPAPKQNLMQTSSLSSSDKAEPVSAKPNVRRILPYGLKNDDLILLAIICALLLNHCEDKLLLLALAYIFFSDYHD